MQRTKIILIYSSLVCTLDLTETPQSVSPLQTKVIEMMGDKPHVILFLFLLNFSSLKGIS